MWLSTFERNVTPPSSGLQMKEGFKFGWSHVSTAKRVLRSWMEESRLPVRMLRIIYISE
jgi:hypothetical protein